MTRKELYDQRLLKEAQQAVMRMHTRRHFLKESAMGLGALALGSFFGGCGRKETMANNIIFDPAHPLLPKLSPFPGKAKSVIYLHMAGAPSQLELFDYKPELMKMDGQDCIIQPWKHIDVSRKNQGRYLEKAVNQTLPWLH